MVMSLKKSLPSLLLAGTLLGILPAAHARMAAPNGNGVCVFTYTKITNPDPHVRLASPYTRTGQKVCNFKKHGNNRLVPLNVNDTRVASYTYTFDGMHMNLGNNKRFKVYKVQPSLGSANYFSFE